MLTISTINDRIGILLDVTGMTKTDFGKKLKVSQAYISKLVKTGTPSPILIDNICEKFGVNENWLLNGDGDMFLELPPEDEVAAAVSEVLEDIHCENAFYTLIKEILVQHERLDLETQKIVDKFFDNVLKEIKTKKEGE